MRSTTKCLICNKKIKNGYCERCQKEIDNKDNPFSCKCGQYDYRNLQLYPIYCPHNYPGMEDCYCQSNSPERPCDYYLSQIED